jgi:hypothetical protein
MPTTITATMRPGKDARLRLVESAPVSGPALSLLLSSLATAALIPAFVLLAPSSSWGQSDLVLAFSGIALISYFSALAVDRVLLLDAAIAVALVAVVFLGPLPAACIWIGTELVAWLFERHRPGPFLSTVASYGWGVIAAALVLDVLAPNWPGAPGTLVAYLVVVLAGVAMLVVSFLIGPCFLQALRYGRRLAETLRRNLVGHLPATLTMIVAGTLVAFLYTQIGVLALVLFAFVVVVPQTVLPVLLKPRPVAELTHPEAVALYADAIADAMKLPRKSRRVLKDAAQYIRMRPLCPRDGKLSDLSVGHRLALVEAVLYYRDYWDGSGGRPGAIGGEMIPIESRVLAVADAWSGLTAKRSPRLTHAQALNQLEARAGLHFDPSVVEAAAKVVEGERFELPERTAFQPRLHRMPAAQLARQLAILSGQLPASEPEPPRA